MMWQWNQVSLIVTQILEAFFRWGWGEVTKHKRIPFLSLDAHNDVDDYSGTLGGVRKVDISALVTLP